MAFLELRDCNYFKTAIMSNFYFPMAPAKWSKLRRTSVTTDQISNLTKQYFPEICRNDQSLNESICILKCEKLHAFAMIDEMKKKAC